MNKKIDAKKLLKWVPVILAAVVAGAQTLGEQKEAERINDMEDRIFRLESKEG